MNKHICIKPYNKIKRNLLKMKNSLMKKNKSVNINPIHYDPELKFIEWKSYQNNYLRKKKEQSLNILYGFQK